MSSIAIAVLEADRGALAGAQRSALGVFGIRIAGAMLAYATQVALARLMGPAGYGVFGTVWVWMVVLGHASLWGVGQSVCRFVPHYRVREELDLVRGFLTAGALTTFVSAAAFAGVGGLILWLGQERIGEAYILPFALALLVLPVFALQDYIEGVARSFNWTVLAIAPAYILRQGLIGGGMIVAVLLGAPADPSVAVGCVLLATSTLR